MGALPKRQWEQRDDDGTAAAAQRAAIKHRTETLQYAPRPGLPERRQHPRLQRCQAGPRAHLQALPGSRDAIVVTRPTYQSALGVFHGWEASFVEIGMDADGMVVDEPTTRRA